MTLLGLQLGTWIALAALILSGLSLTLGELHRRRIRSLEQEREELARLQKKRLQREEDELSRCEVQHYVYQTGKNQYRVALTNTSLVTAYEVRFQFKPNRDWESPAIGGVMDDLFPIESLRPGEDRNFTIAPTLQTGAAWDAQIEWKDEAGTPHARNAFVQLP